MLINHSGYYFYRNIGNSTVPVLVKENVPSNYDVNSTSTIEKRLVFGDVVGDGTIQLVILHLSRIYLYSSSGEVLAKSIDVLDDDYSISIWENLIVTGSRDGSIKMFRYLNIPKTLEELKYFENPLSDIRLKNAAAPAFVDLDGDGDQDAIIVSDDFIVFALNLEKDCSNNCVGRGACSFLRDTNGCTCNENTRGSACETCAPRFYGHDCLQRCPDFSISNTPTFPLESSVENCRCMETFMLFDGKCVCPEGTYLNMRLSRCEPCPFNEYKDVADLSQVCNICPIEGQITKHPGSKSLNDCVCENGFRKFDSKCVCPTGTYFDGESTCKSCPMDQFNDSPGLKTSCRQCRAFSTTKSNGATSINECVCKDGFILEKDQCICPAGSYFESSSCKLCPLGHYNNQPNLNSTCNLCFLGSTTEGFGASSQDNCTCSKERWERLNGECVCSKNYYFDYSSNVCLGCDGDRYITLYPNATSKNECLPGKGNFLSLSGDVISCSHVEGLNCSNKEGLQLSTVPLNRGYWRHSISSTQILQCKYFSHCNPQGKISYEYCSPNHTGVLCSQCLDELRMVNGSCTVCDADLERKHYIKGTGLIFGFVLVFLLPILMVCLSIATCKNENKENSKQFRCCDFRFLNYNQEISVKVRIFLSNLQILLTLNDKNAQNKVVISEESHFVLLKSLVNLNLSGLLSFIDISCYIQINFYDLLLLSTITPLVFILLIGFVLFVGRFVVKLGNVESGISLGLWFMFQILYIVYPGVSSIILQTFSKLELCDVGGDGFGKCELYSNTTVLKADPTLNWDSGNMWRIYACFMVVVYPIGVVLLLSLCIQWLLKQNGKFGAVASAIDFLIFPYTEKCQWYESIDMIRRFCLTAVFLYVYNLNSNDGYILFWLLSTLFFVLFVQLQPYASAIDHVFAFASHSLIFFSILSIIAHALQIVTTTMLQKLSFSFLVIECIAFCLSVAMLVIRQRKKSAKTETQNEEEEEEATNHLIQAESFDTQSPEPSVENVKNQTHLPDNSKTISIT